MKGSGAGPAGDQEVMRGAGDGAGSAPREIPAERARPAAGVLGAGWSCAPDDGGHSSPFEKVRALPGRAGLLGL